jgi:uncharacterized protein (TIGR02271 family)
LREREDITTERPISGVSEGDESLRRSGEFSGKRDVGLSERAAEEVTPRLRQDMAEERREGVETHTLSDRPKERISPAAESRRGEERVIPVAEENLNVGKREVPQGVTRVYSHVESVPIQENVSLREERANIERRPVDRPVTDADRDAFKNTTVEIPEMREEPVVSKEARVKEEVVVGKDTWERTETIRDSARQTRVDVDRGSAEMRGETPDIDRRVGMERRVGAERRLGGERHPMAATGLNAEDEEFRRHYQTMYGGRGDFDAYRSAYHYADEDSEARRYQGRDFSEVEEDLHRSWDQSHPAGSWAQFKEAIRYGWNRKRHI